MAQRNATGEMITDLPPMENYDLQAIHRAPAKMIGVIADPLRVATVYCRSDVLPVTMDINYPNPRHADEGLIHHETSYLLAWPSALSQAEAAEVIGAIGDREPDHLYMWCAGSGFGVAEDHPRTPRPHELVKPLNVDTGAALGQALLDGFGELSVTSPKLVAGWSKNNRAFPGDHTFGIKLIDGSPDTEPLVNQVINLTIKAEHHLAAELALESLGVIFEQYQDLDPESLIDET
jgi:hypothetical protein